MKIGDTFIFKGRTVKLVLNPAYYLLSRSINNPCKYCCMNQGEHDEFNSYCEDFVYGVLMGRCEVRHNTHFMNTIFHFVEDEDVIGER